MLSKSTRVPSVTLRLLLIVAFAAALFGGTVVRPSRAVAGGSGSDLGSNGQHRRPFYNFGHNPNELSEVTGDLAAGANALEPDVMSFSDAAISGTTNINSTAGPSRLFMYHDHVLVATRVPTTVEDWLEFVHAKVVAGANVALIAFDDKSAAATAENGPKLLQAVRNHLNYGTVNVNVIFSVATMADVALFDQIIPQLGPREGVMIDAENDPGAVFNYFTAHGATGHIAYGNGSLGVRYGFAPNVLLGIEAASWERAGQIPAVAIPYAYPIDLESDMNAFITAGADGLIPDVDFPIVAPSDTQDHISTLANVVNSRNDVFLATAADDPFHPAVEAYGLRVVTQDKSGAGTDSNITFTLTGCDGTSSVTVNTDFIGHMEQGDVNYVTLPSKDLGLLRSLTLSSDGSRGGIFSTEAWDPGLVEISSANWGIPYSDHRGVSFTSSIDGSTSQTLPLGGWGHRCADTTSVSSAPNPSVFGQAVTLTATVTPGSPGAGTPTGMVTVFDGATPIGSGNLVGGVFSVTTSSLTAGTHPITAAYAGDSTFLPSTSLVANQVVNQSSTTTTVTSSANPGVFGQILTLTATVAPVSPGSGTPTGSVSLFDGATPIGSGTLVGGSFSVMTALTVGTHSLTATYPGDANFKSSNSPVLPQVVNKAPTAMVLAAAPPGSVGFGNGATFTATVSVPPPGAGSPTGPVRFSVDGTVVQTVNLNPSEQAAVTTSSLGVGTHVITAAYQGDGNFLPSSVMLNYQVTCAVTITGNHPGALLASGASTCLVNATIGGSVTVPKGTSLDVENSTVGGSISANSMANAVRVCGGTFVGGVGVTNAQGLVVVGDPGDANCAVNTMGGTLLLKDNTHGVEAINNKVGNLVIANNSGPGPFPGDVTTISGNHG